MRLARRGIDHQFGIAVIGRDQQRPALPRDRVGNGAQARVDRLDRLDRGCQHTGMTDHVGIGEIEHDEIVAP